MLDDIIPKHVELLHETVPRLSRLAVLSRPANASHPGARQRIDAAARTLGVQVLHVDAASATDLAPAFDRMAREHAAAVIILGDSSFVQHFHQIAALAVKHRLASTYSGREYPDAGGLMSYGPNFVEHYRHAARCVDKILRGAKPADLPFEQPTRLELVINLKTAKTLGLTIPPSLVLRASHVLD